MALLIWKWNYEAVYSNPAGTRRAILSMARKNGKTALIAALVLVHTCGPEAKQNSQIVSGAMSREQSALVFNLASKMGMLNPKLSEIVRVIPSGKRLIGLPMNVEYKATAADAKTAMGASPILIIGNEWGQVRGPQSDYIDSLLTAQGAHADPLQIIISTQSASDQDWLSVQIDDAIASNDPKIVCRLYCAPPDADLLDESAWAAANPAMNIFRSLDDLREHLTQAERMPSMANSAMNLLLNMRVSTDSPFISPTVWASCGGEVLPFDSDTPIFCGLDLSSRCDLTSLVAIGMVEEKWQVQAFFWTPSVGLVDRAKKDRAPYDVWHREVSLRTVAGSTIDYEPVARDMVEILSGLNVQAIAYDRWRIDLMKKELDKLGSDLPLIEWGQG